MPLLGQDVRRSKVAMPLLGRDVEGRLAGSPCRVASLKMCRVALLCQGVRRSRPCKQSVTASSPQVFGGDGRLLRGGAASRMAALEAQIAASWPLFFPFDAYDANADWTNAARLFCAFFVSDAGKALLGKSDLESAVHITFDFEHFCASLTPLPA